MDTSEARGLWVPRESLRLFSECSSNGDNEDPVDFTDLIKNKQWSLYKKLKLSYTEVPYASKHRKKYGTP